MAQPSIIRIVNKAPDNGSLLRGQVTALTKTAGSAGNPHAVGRTVPVDCIPHRNKNQVAAGVLLSERLLILWSEEMFDYSNAKWKKKRMHILRLDGYKDKVAAMYGRTEEATTVHHIYPAAQYPEYAWQDWNLISVSQGSHNKLENRKTGELTELGRMLMDRTKPGIDWRTKRG